MKFYLLFAHNGSATQPAQFLIQCFSPPGFCKLGYNVLMVNYTGSLGIDRQAVFDLVGNIGRYDVDDVHQGMCIVVSSISKQ